MSETLAKRFLSKVEILNLYGCWTWQGGKAGKYGAMYYTTTVIGRKQIFGRAHRISYHLCYPNFPVVAINTDDNLDHLCRNKLCVNPLHLEPVSSKENKRRQLTHLRS